MAKEGEGRDASDGVCAYSLSDSKQLGHRQYPSFKPKRDGVHSCCMPYRDLVCAIKRSWRIRAFGDNGREVANLPHGLPRTVFTF